VSEQTEQIIREVIRDFAFWDYGMDDVDPQSEYAEWVPDLAANIAKALERGAP
jgi:hypothetical protein